MIHAATFLAVIYSKHFIYHGNVDKASKS